MSLIEVLVSLVILSLGVLAVVALQLVAKRNNADAGQRTIAAQLAYDILERMRANSTALALLNYQTGSTPLGNASRSTPNPNCSSSQTCSEVDLVRYDLWAWEQAVDGAAEVVGGAKSGGLLYPRGCIAGPAAGGDGVYTVTISWRGSIAIPDVNSDADTTNDVACGNDLTVDGVRVYGDDDQFRRTLTMSVYITARRRTAA